jgi:hypothetical protein
MKMTARLVVPLFAAFLLVAPGFAQQKPTPVQGKPAAAQGKKIYWDSEVPKGWNGKWLAKFQTVPEKTGWDRTTSTYEAHEFIEVLRWNSDRVYAFNMFRTNLGKISSAVVLANPRVTTPEEARASGKPVIYLQGNIHPPEAEGKEALLMVMRDILLGTKKHLLDNQIIIICPVLNADGTDAVSAVDPNPTRQPATPGLAGTRVNVNGYDLNRDAIKLQTPEVTGLYQTVLNAWDPVLLFDSHAMGRVKHGYAIVYATANVPTAHAAPREYVWSSMFPAIRQSVRDNFGLETFTHCMFDEENWPPTVWSHDLAAWTVEGKFLASAYALRNRMTIIVETPGHPPLERKTYAQYAYINELLEYTNKHGKEMVKICNDADHDVVNQVRAQAESGQLKNYVEGKYKSRGKIDILAYRKNEPRYLPGTSMQDPVANGASGAPEVLRGVEDLTKPVGTKEAMVPRGYLIPAELDWVAAKLRTLNIKVDVLDKPTFFTGEEFVVDRVKRVNKNGYDMSVLEGGFAKSPRREFPAGTFRVDLAQPLAYLAFYALEPEVGDGLAGWRLLDDYLRSIGAGRRSVVYPVYKYLKVVD